MTGDINDIFVSGQQLVLWEAYVKGGEAQPLTLTKVYSLFPCVFLLLGWQLDGKELTDSPRASLAVGPPVVDP